MKPSRADSVLKLGALLLPVLLFCSGEALAQDTACEALPNHAELTNALGAAVEQDNAGFGNDMWATMVDRDGIVCAVTFSGDTRGDQWPGSRVISAQKANTANAFSLEDLALSTGNLYGLVQPGGSLFGLQFSNPVDPAVAYQGPASQFGQQDDPMVGQPIGGVNVFGGGLALYDVTGALIGGLGVSGDTSCTDHIIAWKVRDALGLDNIPGGVADDGTDNLILADPPEPNTFDHPVCGFDETGIIPDLATNFPIGS